MVASALPIKSMYLYLYIYLCTSISLYLCIHMYLYLCIYVYIIISLSLCLSVCLCLSLSLCLSVSLSLCLSVLSVSRLLLHPHRTAWKKRRLCAVRLMCSSLKSEKTKTLFRLARGPLLLFFLCVLLSRFGTEIPLLKGREDKPKQRAGQEQAMVVRV